MTAKTLCGSATDFSSRIRKNLLFLQIIPQRDAGSHDGGELDVVHDVGAGVSGQVFFQDLFAYSADAGG